MARVPDVAHRRFFSGTPLDTLNQWFLTFYIQLPSLQSDVTKLPTFNITSQLNTHKSGACPEIWKGGAAIFDVQFTARNQAKTQKKKEKKIGDEQTKKKKQGHRCPNRDP